MARRRYGEVTSGSGKSHQGRRITMAQPVSSILGDVVKSSRSIAHSDDFEGHKLIQTNSRQLILLDLNILYWCPASHGQIQTPIGTASNFLQCKWVSCSKSYWQGCDLGWYKDMGAPCFPQPNLWLARCASMSWTALKKFVVLSAQELRIGIKPSFHCGRKAWQVLSVLRQKQEEEAAAAASKQQQQQGSSRQAAGKQQTAFAPLKEWSNIFFKINAIKKNDFFPAARPQNNEIVQLLKVVVMPKLNFFQAHGLPIRLLQADTT